MSVPDGIPFLDLVAPHVELEQELTEVLRKALNTAGFIGGPMVEKFEESFAQFCGVNHAVGVGSGTDALRFALLASGVQHDDVVLTVPNTFIATTEAISQCGALPEFIDIDPVTYNMSVVKLREYVQEQCTRSDSGGLISLRSRRRVTAVVPVHLYGQMADMDPILEVAEQNRLIVIEDACQAHGAEYFSRKHGRWFKAGSMGQAAAFSFYPGKNLGACGEAGAVTTNDETIASSTRMIRDHGQAKKYYHNLEGYNGRLDAIQAGFLTVKLKHLDEWNSRRQDAARRYIALFEQSLATHGLQGITPPHEPHWSRANYHLFVVRTADREHLIKEIARQGVGTGIHYPIPLHLQQAYSHLGYTPGELPCSERVCKEVVSLPMFPTLTSRQQEKVVLSVTKFCAEACYSVTASGSR